MKRPRNTSPWPRPGNRSIPTSTTCYRNWPCKTTCFCWLSGGHRKHNIPDMLTFSILITHFIHSDIQTVHVESRLLQMISGLEGRHSNCVWESDTFYTFLFLLSKLWIVNPLQILQGFPGQGKRNVFQDVSKPQQQINK